MKRRDWIKTALAAAAMPAAARGGGKTPAKIESKVARLMLKHTWTTTMSSSQYRDTLQLAYTREGVTGRGEGAPIVRYHEDAKSAEAAVNSIRDYLAVADPWEFSKVMSEVFRRMEGQYAAKAAIDIALMDWIGKRLGVPLYRYFGLDPHDAPVTTFSIGIDTPEITRPS